MLAIAQVLQTSPSMIGMLGTRPFSRAEGCANEITAPKSESSFQDVVCRHRAKVSLSILQDSVACIPFQAFIHIVVLFKWANA